MTTFFRLLKHDDKATALADAVDALRAGQPSKDVYLEALRTQKAAAGGTGRDAKRLGKEVERQEEFLSELRDFEDKLRRAANLHLEPDLNDGVVLNIAPLHELVPWKEAKSYWQELLDGQYEWSSIGKQLREKGHVK